MHYPLPLKFKDWLAAPLLGGLLGLLLLGTGARLGMRLVALQLGLLPGFSIGGTMTVIFLSGTVGAAAGLILVAVRGFFSRSQALRVVVYWGLVAAYTVYRLWPLDELRALVFLPIAAVFAATLQWAWGHGYLAFRLRQWQSRAGQVTV